MHNKIVPSEYENKYRKLHKGVKGMRVEVLLLNLRKDNVKLLDLTKR